MNFIILKIIIKQFKPIEGKKKLNEGKELFFNMKIVQLKFFRVEKLIIEKIEYYKSKET